SDFKDSQIPLARIKKLLKTDPEIRMIANEVIVLLDKACQIFVNEITVRAFLVATSSNRRTINTSDIASAVSQSDMFDFLIDIVPP
ncbi:histone-fold-containing protein, partial [Phakopsora pachyrhizi]